ncbi:acyl carrier protein [Williamsia sp. MIQD14]|uniref:acyl carrier protein n=1 Tax=Williamsia sp. MIQD14 TaxID=3425703 RepID=UPI003DA012B5
MTEPTADPGADRVHDELRDILANDLDLSPDHVTGSARLVDDLGLDSVAVAIGVVAIEERLGVALTEREIFESASVADLEQVIRSRLAVVGG